MWFPIWGWRIMNGFPLSPWFRALDLQETHAAGEIPRTLSKIELVHEFEEALEGLEEGSLLLVLFRFHLCKGFSMKVRPRGIWLILSGVFSTCSPCRPNHIGASIV